MYSTGEISIKTVVLLGPVFEEVSVAFDFVEYVIGNGDAVGAVDYDSTLVGVVDDVFGNEGSFNVLAHVEVDRVSDRR